MLDWKINILKNIGIDNILRLSKEDWVLLALYVDGNKPVSSVEVLHFMFFFYTFSPFNYKFLLFSPFSEELHKAVENVIEKGYAIYRTRFESGRILKSIELTQRGKERARKIVKSIFSSWVLVREVIVRLGREVIEELESLKKTYNDRTLPSLLKLLAMRVEAEGTMYNANLSDEEKNFLVNLSKRYLKDIRVENID